MDRKKFLQAAEKANGEMPPYLFHAPDVGWLAAGKTAIFTANDQPRETTSFRITDSPKKTDEGDGWTSYTAGPFAVRTNLRKDGQLTINDVTATREEL